MATVAYEFDCNTSAGFVMDPNQHVRVGWVTALDGFGRVHSRGLGLMLASTVA